MNGDAIIIMDVATVDILRQEGEDNQALKARVEEAKRVAKLKGGKIDKLRRYADDYILVVFFPTKKAKEEWLAFIKAKKLD